FFYTLEGDQRGYETDVSIKAGREKGLGFDGVGADCDCDGDALPAPDAFVQTIPLWEEISEVQDNDQPRLTAYPNPASNHVYLKLSQFDVEQVDIQLVDMLGRVVLSERRGHTTNETIELQVPDGIRDGMYFIRVMNAPSLKPIPIVIYQRN
ncbi:MAG: T9SS type A sorting domain-containing protein, partial [Saprospiraceae bacterium]|nr:T9SS type A sorting domain-containing protein [Saprospiraceae bacterium]